MYNEDSLMQDVFDDEELPNLEVDKFYRLLKDVEHALYTQDATISQKFPSLYSYFRLSVLGSGVINHLA